MDCLPTELSGKRFGEVVLPATAVRRSGKDVASDRLVLIEVRGDHVRVIPHVGAAAERCRY